MEVTGTDAERFLETVSPADLLNLPKGSGLCIIYKRCRLILLLDVLHW